MKLTIIIPLYNEEKTISEVVNKLNSIQYPSTIDEYEIIIVDDGSKDQSAEVSQQLSQKYDQIHLVRKPLNQGKGAAMRTGLEHATGDVILFQDADLELNPEDIPSMINAMTEFNVEFVNGSRYLPGMVRPLASYRRYLANRLFTFLTSLLINVKLTDMACGYKLIHRNLLSKIKIQENRFGIEAELIIKALKIKKNNIIEVPVQYRPRLENEGKKLRNIDAFRILFTIVRYTFS